MSNSPRQKRTWRFKRSHIGWSAPVALLVIAYILFGDSLFRTAAKVRYVAYIGRYSNHLDTVPIARQPRNKFDVMHEMALRNYLDELNGRLRNLRLELKTFDNQRDQHVSDSLYSNVIAPDSNIVLVIDNTWGEHLRPCAESIRRNAIPIISLNADRSESDYGDAALFIGNDDDTPRDITAFLIKALSSQEIIFITETDYPLHDVYLKTFAAEGITVRKQFELRGKSKPTEAARDSLMRTVKEHIRSLGDTSNTTVVINAHTEWGRHIVEFLDRTLHDATILAHAMVIDVNTAGNFGANGNQLIVLTRPNDALTKKISNDLDRFRAVGAEYFDSPSAPFFIKRCLDAVEIIRGMDARLDSLPLSREAVRSYLRSLRGGALAGEYDLYEFNDDRLVKDIYFTKYRDKKFYSYPVQLNSDRRIIPNLFFGVDILDMYDIDVNTNTFKSDFFYWVKVDTAHRDAEKFITFANIQQTQSSRELLMEKIDGEILYRLYKVSGTFHHDFELRSFPLDRQEVTINVEILDPANRLKISFDQSSLDEDEKIFERFNVRAWDKLKYYVTVDNRVSASMRGDPDNQEGKLTVFKNFSFRLLIKRKFGGPFLEIVLPLSLIGFVAIALLYVTDISFENLGEVSVGTFLGIITFSIALSNITPSSDYLTKADLLFWITFMVVLVSFMTVIVVNSRYRVHELEEVTIKPIRYVLTLLYPLSILWVLLLY